MTDDLNAVPNQSTRMDIAKRIRDTASLLANKREIPFDQKNNGEVKTAIEGADADMVAAHGSFTKGLHHDVWGRVKRGDLRKFVSEINQDQGGSSPSQSPFPGTYGSGKPAPFDAPLYDGGFARPQGNPGGKARGWESPISGHVYDLEGPDADQVAMPPAPSLGSDELTTEVGEVYGAALLRDRPFGAWKSDGKVADVADLLANLPFYKNSAGRGVSGPEGRRAARTRDGATLDPGTLFRGSTKGAQRGPYVSQFMLIGNAERANAEKDGKRIDGTSEGIASQDGLTRAQSFVPTQSKLAYGYAADEAVYADGGFIRYGAQTIDQRFRPHAEAIDHMTEWTMWCDVQNGSNRKDIFDFFLEDANGKAQSRFVSTPRDLATYVHFDALYQAYLNACLILLGEGYSSDIGLPEGGGQTRDAFATFGGPHILTLVTEVATRALKAVRRQKYNVHLRSRPEVVAAAVAMSWKGDLDDKLGGQAELLGKMSKALKTAPDGKPSILELVKDLNKTRNDWWNNNNWDVELGPIDENHNALLPMAFPEGSPMHPAYGAGHATVAGACVTILKAFFEMYDTGNVKRGLRIWDYVNKDNGYPAVKCPVELFGDEKPLLVTVGENGDGSARKQDAHYVPDPKPVGGDPSKAYTKLKRVPGATDVLTVQGELDKLAANIAIGRNFGGVHFYTDYYESLRMGERIAVGILQEQMLCYRESVSMRLTSFDGDRVMICGTGGSRGLNDTPVYVWDKDGNGGTEQAYRDWWTRHYG